MPVASAPPPRGIRNHNPLNIRLNPANKWQGRVPPAENGDGAFEQFETAIWGLRAAAVLIIAHHDRRGADSIARLVALWAPPSENDTARYVGFVSRESGFGPDQPLDLHRAAHLKPVLLAMIRMENGCQPYTDAEIDAALARAGVLPPEKPLSASRTVKGGRAAATGTIGIAAVDALQQAIGPAQDTLADLAPTLDAAKWALLAVTLLGLGVMLWARIDDHRRGLR
ncbi:MAG: structural protein P5 [Rhodospirillales bacterium]|nr:structural protein P5 [Rhodospirillales bacterium]